MSVSNGTVNRKLNILQVHNYYQIPGGEDTVVANEKILLEKHGHKVVQYCRDNTELRKFSKIRKLLLPCSTIFNLKTYIDVKRIICQENIDIVHVHNTLNLISPSVYYAALRCKVPVLQTVHNFRLLCPGATFYRDGHICEECVKKGLRCAVKYSCYRESRVQTFICVFSTWLHRLTGVYGKLNYVCLTEFNKKKLLNLKQINSDKVFVKPNFAIGCYQSFIPYEKRLNQFIFVGRLDKLKGIDILLNTWQIMGKKAPRLLICGTGPMENWCKEFVKDNCLNTVELLGFVSNEEVRKLIANSKALILPTQWYEGFPMTIVEAYSVGTPVIASDIGNVGELVFDGISGWKFRYDDPCDLKRVLTLDMNQNDNVYNISLRYRADDNYKKLLNIYNKCLYV